MFTREGEFRSSSAGSEPVAIPLPYPLGTEIPLTARLARAPRFGSSAIGVHLGSDCARQPAHPFGNLLVRGL